MRCKFTRYEHDGSITEMTGEIIDTFYEEGDPIPAHVIRGDNGQTYTIDSQDTGPA